MLPLPSIHLTCPYPLESLNGNSVSARRILSILRELGFTLSSGTPDQIGEADADIHLAMHATRSHAAVVEFHWRFPDRPTVVLLTGTDLYRDFPARDASTIEAMEIADRLVVTQSSSLNSLPNEWRTKASVVTKSLEIDLPEQSDEDLLPHDGFDVVMAIHGRATKDPFLALRALALLPDLTDLGLTHIGRDRGDCFGEQARQWLEREPRYHWLGELPHEETLRRIHRADLTLNTSIIEGGANSILEAIMCGVPILASDIEPNVGQLGEGFPGLFGVGDAAALAGLIERCYRDAGFLNEVRSATIARQPMFTREAEASAWMAAIGEVARAR